MMARIVSGMRFARSFATPVNTVIEQDMDFDLGARLGIAIHWVLGMMIYATETFTADALATGQQTLHLETDATEDFPIAVAEDEVAIDSEVLFMQGARVQYDLTTDGASHGPMQSHLFVPYPEPIITARNITHRAESSGATRELLAHIMIGYKYVELTDAELIGVLTSRR